jgi:ABC-type molybdate transport system ATPase subunit
MLQVTFHDVLPSVEVVTQVHAARVLLRAQSERARAASACLSVTLTHHADREAIPFRVLVELVHGERSRVAAVTQAYDPQLALRSGLSVATTAAAGSLAAVQT